MSEFQEEEPQREGCGTRWDGLGDSGIGGNLPAWHWDRLERPESGKATEQNVQASVKQQNEALMQRMAKTDDENQQLQSDLKVVTNKLNVTQEELDRARKITKSSVVAYNKEAFRGEHATRHEGEH